MKTKKCKKCNETLPISEYSISYTRKDGSLGYNTLCHKCHYQRHRDKKLANSRKHYSAEKSRKYYIENQDKIKHRSLQQYHKNPEKSKELATQWRKDNPERHKELSREYGKKYAKQNRNNPDFLIKECLRSSLYRGIKQNRDSLVLRKLGITFTEYKKYIESKFKPEMNWDNWGDVWELDHIIPICDWDMTNKEEVNKCFHYSNTQPLFKTTEIAISFGYYDEIGNRNKNKY